ncbi:MAG: rod-binding protein [Desulfobacterota bacterium]|jgi:flagellar protein FlgJ|nr:rod-binding protein [Thermodesulfobacteriota bacterium]
MIGKIEPSGNGTRGMSLPRLREVCAEFEALFLSHLLKTMRASMAEGGLLGKSHQGEVMGALVDEKIALDMAKKRGMGMGELLFETLRKSPPASDSGKADE